ncbi:MAG: histidine kinase [Chitinophagaceae bacterium]|nr:histidine kinase [Chitinophagaceae bacterium]
MHYGKLIFLLLLLIGTIDTAVAQQQAHFNNLTEKDGLSNNRVTCFYKDKAGYLWIGTESGLNRYNGNNWKIYKPSPRKKNYLSNSFITDIEQDAKESIWVSTRKGLNRIDVVAGTTEVFLPDDTGASVYAIPNDLIWDTYPDTDTSIWIAADAREFCHYNPVQKKFYYYDFIEYLAKNHFEINPAYHSIFRILPKSSAELWLATTDGVFSFNKQTGSFILLAAMALNSVTFFYFDTRVNKLYCADRQNKLHSIDPEKKETAVISLDKNKYRDKINLIYGLDKQYLFVPSSEGLVCVNEKNEVLYFLEGTAGKENALLPGKINCIYKDRQQITWVGTANGVSKFIPAFNNNLNISFPNSFTLDPDLSLKNFIYDPLSDEWLIASWKDNTVYTVNNTTGIVTKLKKPATFRDNNCYAFYSNNEDSIFMLGNGHLLLRHGLFTKWDKITLPPPYHNSVIICMAIDPEGNYWLGNMRRELFIYSPVTKKIWTPSKNDIDRDLTRCLATDFQNNCMWIGTSGYGLIRYDFSNNTFRFIETNIKSETAIHSFLINDILPDGKGNIWVATFEGGLAKYNASLPSGKGVVTYNTMVGLPDDNIYSLAPDGKGGAWFTTINGIGHIASDGSRKGLYNQQSGLPYSKFQQSIVALPTGKIATVMENNFICFDPGTSITSYEYPVVIDDIIVNDTMTLTGVSGANTKTFSYKQNAFTFHYAVLDFISPGALEYYYMLKGYENDWVHSGAQHSVRYSKLAPGTYTFMVKAKSENGDYYSPVAVFRFYIHPPFWQTWWFRAACALFAAGLIFWLIRKRIKFIRHEAELKQKIAETEMMALRAQMNPHFIFNCLNSIDNLIQNNEKEKATTYLAKFAKLIRAILENSKNNVIPCWKDMETLQLYLELEELRCDKRFSYKVNIDADILHGDYKVPPLVIQPFVENAIHHGLMNKKESDKELHIFVSAENNEISYVIEDNGVGRKQAAEYKKLNRSFHNSMGIDITMERINLFNGKNGSVKITDIYDEQQQAKGTKVEVRLVNQN